MSTKSLVTMALSVMKISNREKFDALMVKVNALLDENYYNEVDREEEVVSCLAEDELFSRCAVLILVSAHSRKPSEYYLKDIIKEVSNGE